MRDAKGELSDDLKAGRIAADHIGATHSHAHINSKEAAYCFQIFRQFHPQDSILSSIGIWTGFDFAEERQPVQGTVDGDLNYHPMQNRQN
jgi:asparagine synthase (glutamine-hydrolysing)